MITLFHGDDLVASRRALPRGVPHYDLTELTPEKLEQVRTGKDLFNQHQDIYLWSGKKLTAVQIKSLQPDQVKEFKLARSLWQFLRTLSLKDLEFCLKTEPVELVWYLLHRQFSRQGKTEKLKQMFALELEFKSGQNPVPLRTRLELLL